MGTLEACVRYLDAVKMIFSTLAVVLLAAYSDACGTPSVQGNRVIAGETAVRGSWPWQILMKFNGQPGCGGSIVGPRHIVTAAHCVYQRSSVPKYFTVRVGEHDRLKSSGNEVDYAVKKVMVHPKWSP